MLQIIKQKFFTYQHRMMADAFRIWRENTEFVSKTALYVDIAGNSLIQSEKERIDYLKSLLAEK